MIIVAVAIMVGMVIMTVVTVIVVALAPVTVVVTRKLRYQCFALCEQVTLLVEDFLFHFRNLALNLF